MKNFKALLTLVLFVGVFGILLSSCTTTSPILYTDNPKKDFAILGEVTYEDNNKIGYRALLDAAKKQYPDCDYVIDVMVDRKKTIILFFTINSYIMRGTAIKYKTDTFSGNTGTSSGN